MLKFLLSRIPEEPTRPTILLIDDDRDIRTITTLVLMTSGLGEVVEAGSGQEGLEMARQQRPDVILLDFHLPDMCGATVLQLLKADPWTRDIPVVLFTAQDTDRRVLESLPVVDLVFKPFQPNELCATLRNAMQGMRRHRRPHRAQHAHAHSGVQRATL